MWFREGSEVMERGFDQIHILKGFLGPQYEEMAKGCRSEFGEAKLAGSFIFPGKDKKLV